MAKFSKENNNKVVYFAAFFEGNAGFHWRTKTWCEILNANDIECRVVTLWNIDTFNRYVCADSNSLKSIYNIIRVAQLIKYSWSFNKVVVRRELIPYSDIGNHFAEKCLRLLYSDKILDFDDDISSAKHEPVNTSFAGSLLGMTSTPFSSSLVYYDRFIVGNKFLMNKLISSLNPNKTCLVLPTCFDSEQITLKTYSSINTTPIIGWLGSSTNQYVLDFYIDELNNLYKMHPFKLTVVSGKLYSNPKAMFPITNETWALETEKEKMQSFDIGIMPLTGAKHEEGKSGFKLIQYLSIGLVTVSTGIGINKEIVNHGANGFIHELGESLADCILNVLNGKDNWEKIGLNGYNSFVQLYSFQSQKDRFIDFIQNTQTN